jgi:hypothetical protein
MDISPIAQVALLHTEMNSGFKFRPRTGIRSTENKHDVFSGFRRETLKVQLYIPCVSMHHLHEGSCRWKLSIAWKFMYIY